MTAKSAKILDSSKDDTHFPLVQITYMERISNGVITTPYGYHCNPPKDTHCLLITVNGDESAKYVIPLSENNRPKGLKENEAVTGNFKIGSIIKFDENGNIYITCKNNLNAQVSGKVDVISSGDIKLQSSSQIVLQAPNIYAQGDFYSSGDITDNYSINSLTIGGMRTTYNTHTHNETGSVTNAPNQPM